MKLIYGVEKFFVNKNIAQERAKFNEEDIIVLDENITIYDLISLVANKSLIDTKKLIIVNDFSFLTTSKFTKEQTKFVHELLRLFANGIEDEIIFVVNSAKLAENDLVKYLKDNAGLVQCNKVERKDLIEQLSSIAQKRGVKFSFTNINVFLEKMPDNLEIIMNEFELLISNYKEVTFDIIESTVSKYAKNQVFAFLSSLESNNLRAIYSKYLERIEEGDELPLLLGQMNSLFSDCLNVHHLNKIGLNTLEISKKMKMPEWKIKKINSVLRSFGFAKLKKMILELADMDVEFKTKGGEINEIFEMFLIKNFS
ncbi:DNA polymerase III subunit delta [Mycoplasmopsis edwardii]|nr:DNA polymerase III subunit delta [Mycoplasmopsis edwardii]